MRKEESKKEAAKKVLKDYPKPGGAIV